MTIAGLACGDFTFPLLTHDKSLRFIAMLGFRGVDIGLFEERSHLWLSREFAATRRAAGQLKKRLGGLGLQAADIFLQIGLDFNACAVNHPQSRRRHLARNWFLETLDYAVVCESRHVTILPGARFPEEKSADSFGRATDELAWRVEEAQSAGVVLGVEAHIGSLAPRPRPARF